MRYILLFSCCVLLLSSCVTLNTVDTSETYPDSNSNISLDSGEPVSASTGTEDKDLNGSGMISLSGTVQVPKNMKFSVMPQTATSIVQNIVSVYGLDIEKSSLPRVLIPIQESCIGKGFLTYRQCFIDMIGGIERSVLTGEETLMLDRFLATLEQEIEFYPYYQELGEMNYPDQDIFVEDNVTNCYIHQSQQLPELSYRGEIRDILLPIFRDFDKDTVYDTASYTGESMDSNNLCLFRTFGPSVGHIFHAVNRENRTYIFVKTDDGGGSGEFTYAIYVYAFSDKSIQKISTFWGWSGILPFGRNLNVEPYKVLPVDMYKNRPFIFEGNTPTEVSVDMQIRRLINE